jgi:ribosomal protein S11
MIFLKRENTFMRKSSKQKLLMSKKNKTIKRNLINSSYNNRFVKPKYRILYFKTIKQQQRDFNENVEQGFYNYLNYNIERIERRQKTRRQRTGLFTPLIPMKFRPLTLTRVFVTHGIKNTFVTVFRGQKGDVENDYKMSVTGKFSCGLAGYKGPKKSTVFARKEVIKSAGQFVSSLLTTLMTVVFTSKVGRWNRKTVRNLAPDLAYVVSIYNKRTRSHGHQKYKNRRRT